jgi:hypothetical protein
MRSPLTVGLRKMRSAASLAMEHVLTMPKPGARDCSIIVRGS